MSIVAERTSPSSDTSHLHPDAKVHVQGGSTPRAGHRGGLKGRLFSEGGVVVVVTSALYLTVASLLAFRYHLVAGDAVARMANGFYVLYSRDPHLAAIGFVWEPLQSIADMLFLLPNHLWPALSHRDMAGAFVSVIGMVGAVHQLRSALREWGVQRAPRLVLTALFALDPMILYYSGNGMSEGLYLFTLVAATRYLLRWIRTKSLSSLAYAGVWLGLCYLTRNEAIGAAVAGLFAVVLVSYSDSSDAESGRFAGALHDGVIFFLPCLIAVAGWAIASYVIVGEFFAQFSSVYGNSSQEAFLTHKKLGARVSYEIHTITSLAPLLVLILLVAIEVALRRKDFMILGPISVVGGALAFDAAAYLNNSIQDFYRYFITTVPLEVLLVGSLFAVAVPSGRAINAQQEDGPSPPGPGRRRTVAAVVAVVVSLALLVPALITTGAAMLNPKIAPEELKLLGPILHSHPSATDKVYGDSYATIVNDANILSRLHLPNGSIVFDNFVICAPDIITNISQPKVFVIPNDRDFKKILFDPKAFHARYILEANPNPYNIQATNIQYPTLWSTGDGFAKQVLQIPARSICPEFRLFRVIRHTSTPAG